MSTSVCLSVCPPGYLRSNTRDLYQIFVRVAYGRGSVLLRQGDEIPRGSGDFGVFLPIGNAVYSIVFGTHAKTTEPIDMPFWTKTRVCPRNHVLHGSADPEGEGVNFVGCPGHSKALAIFAAAVAAAFATNGIGRGSGRHSAGEA